MRLFGLFLLNAMAIAAIGYGTKYTGLIEAISLSPHPCSDGRVARPFDGLSLLLFAIAVPLSVLLSRGLFYRGNYLKPVDPTGQGRNVVALCAVSTALFLIVASMVTYLLQYFVTPCMERYLDRPMSEGGDRIVLTAILFSLVGALFSDLIRYRVSSRRDS